MSYIKAEDCYKILKEPLMNYMVVKYPTNNCQVGSIGNFRSLLNLDKVKFNNELKKIYSEFEQDTYIIDINVKLKDKFELLVSPNKIIFQKEYKNNNRTEMLMALIKIT